MQQGPSAQQVGEQTDHRDHHHLEAAHGFRRQEAMIGFVENQAGDDKQGDPVEQGGEDLHPRITVMFVGGRRFGGEPHRQQTEDQRTHVAQHVPGIRQQGQTVRGQSAEELQQQDDRGDPDGNAQTFFIVRDFVVTHHPTP